MKLRIKGNSVRLRLTKSEVERFCSGASLEVSTLFGENIFTYSLKSNKEIDALSAEFKSGKLTIYIPSSFIKDWNTNDIVGFNSGTLNSTSDLHILVEKDFKCLDETTEDQSDNFENPHTSCQE